MLLVGKHYSIVVLLEVCWEVCCVVGGSMLLCWWKYGVMVKIGEAVGGTSPSSWQLASLEELHLTSPC